MGLSDRDYSRAHDAIDTRATRPRGGWGFGRIRSSSPRGGLSASFVIILICSAVYFIDALLPKTLVQAGPWIVAPTLRESIQSLVQDLAKVDAALESARRAGDAGAIARLEEVRSARSSAVEERLGMLDDASSAWEARRARGDYAVRDVRIQSGSVRREALDPRMPSAVDPLAVARFDLVGPIRGALQFTTAQALWVPQKWGSAQGLEFWRFVGYGVLHVSLMHLVFNMLGLWIFGPVVEAAFGRLRYFAVFVLSVVVGALLYFLLNIAGLGVLGATGGEFVVPGLLFNNPYLPLIGASAGVYGVILAAAWLRPDDEILLLFIFPMKMRYFALFLIGVAVITLLQNGQNAGGEAAHLGGAIAGWWIAQRPHLLDDFFPFFHRIDGRRAPRPAKRPGGTVRGGTRTSAPSEAEIDRILDKVRERGLASLTEREREALRNATELQRGRDG